MIDHERVAQGILDILEANSRKDRDTVTVRFDDMFSYILGLNLPIPKPLDVSVVFSGGIPNVFQSPRIVSPAEIADALRTLPDDLIEVTILRYMLKEHSLCVRIIGLERDKNSKTFVRLAEKIGDVIKVA